MQTPARILIVDDNRAIHADFLKILRPEKSPSLVDDMEADLFETERAVVEGTRFEVDSAYQGQEGLLKVQQSLTEGRPYALAFVDGRMPPRLGRRRDHRPPVAGPPGSPNRHLHGLLGLLVGADCRAGGPE